MTPSFINSNPHHAYVDTGDVQLLKLRPFEQVERDGVAADRLEETPGIVNLDELSKDERATLDQRIADHRLAVEGASTLGPDALAGSPEAAADDGDQGAEETTTEPPKSEKPKEAPKLPKAPPKVGKGSDTKSWAKFAKSLGLDVPKDAKRADLFKLVDKHLAKVERETKKAESGGTVTSDKVPKKGQ